MTTKQAVQAALAMIVAVHTGEIADADKIGAWTDLLGDLPPELIVSGTREVLRTSAYPPKPSEVRAAAIPRQLGAEEAWMEFVEQMREPRKVLDGQGDERYVLPSWTSEVVRDAGEPVAAEVVAMIDRGDTDDYALRRAYCERYDRILATALARGEWHRLDMGDHVPGRLYLADGGFIDGPTEVASAGRERPTENRELVPVDAAEMEQKVERARKALGDGESGGVGP